MDNQKIKKMIKHYVNYNDNIYYVEEDNIIVMSIELNKEKNEVIIRTPNDEYYGNVREIKILKKT